MISTGPLVPTQQAPPIASGSIDIFPPHDNHDELADEAGGAPAFMAACKSLVS
jgi:hypothetical protein